MDIFNEQIVNKKKSLADIALVAFIFLASLAVAILLLFFVISIAPQFIMTAIVLDGVIFYLAFKVARFVNIEFEYSVTNNLFDVDKIIARSSRKRLASLDIKKIDDIGAYSAEKFQGKTFDIKINAAGDPTANDLVYVVARHPSKGKMLIIFEPNEKIISALKKSLPYAIKNNI